MNKSQFFLIISAVLMYVMGVTWVTAYAGENGGVATGEQYQSWRVALDTPHGPVSIAIDPYSSPYSGWPMTNRLMDKIVHDCGLAAGGDCSYVSHSPMTVGYSDQTRAQYPDLPDPFRDIPVPEQWGKADSYLWSDAFARDRSMLWTK